VAEDLTLYLSESEQIPSAMGLGIAMSEDRAAIAGAGFLVQTLPGADDSEIARVESNVKALPPLSELILAGLDSDDLVDRLLEGLGARERHRCSPIFYCPCDGERALRAVGLLERSTLEEIIRDQETQEVCCHFCGQRYEFSPSDVATLLPRT